MLTKRILIACLFVASVGLAAACGGQSPTSTPEPTATAIATPVVTETPSPTSPGITERTPTPVPATAQPESMPVSIALDSTTQELRPGQEFRVAVSVDPKGQGISGVELEFRFDPAVLQVVEVVPGDLLGEKTEEIKAIIPIIQIDDTSGILSYADVRTGVTSPPTPPGLLATIRLRVLETAPAPRETSLKITSVKIPDETIQGLLDVQTGDGLTLEISP